MWQIGAPSILIMGDKSPSLRPDSMALNAAPETIISHKFESDIRDRSRIVRLATADAGSTGASSGFWKTSLPGEVMARKVTRNLNSYATLEDGCGKKFRSMLALSMPLPRFQRFLRNQVRWGIGHDGVCIPTNSDTTQEKFSPGSTSRPFRYDASAALRSPNPWYAAPCLP